MTSVLSSVFFVFIVLGCVLGPSSAPDPADGRRVKRQQLYYGVTNLDITKSVKHLEKVLQSKIQSLESKLSRHEFREVEVADFSTKTLNAVNAGLFQMQKKVQGVARQLAKMEEKMFGLEALITTTDERQRRQLSQLSEGLNRLLVKPPSLPDLPALPPPPSSKDLEKEIKKINRKLNGLQGAMTNDMKNLKNEVNIVGETLDQHMKQLRSRQDALWKDWNTCNKEHIQEIGQVATALSATRDIFTEQVLEAKELLTEQKERGDNHCNTLSNEVVDRLNAIDKAYEDQEKEIAVSYQDTKQALEKQNESILTLLKETRTERETSRTSIDDILTNLNALKNVSDTEFSEIETALDEAAIENSQRLKNGIDNVASILKIETSSIMAALEDSVSQTDNLQERISGEFSDLAKDIRSIKKVEQVMLSTADAVLDTKRSIEFGIQQVIIELSEIVKNSGQNINSTLLDHITNISFNILKNQTAALTNMTSKMEREISRVWRQIGIMYQQVAQSTDILGDLKESTAQQMNASLDKVGNMDGTVGQINTKVADVEDNLNYLLGRLSLVVSEFSQMKTGVGEELNRLRDMAEEFSGKDIVEYKVNRKRRRIPKNNDLTSKD